MILILILVMAGYAIVQAYYLGVRNEANYFEKIYMLQYATP